MTTTKIAFKLISGFIIFSLISCESSGGKNEGAEFNTPGTPSWITATKGTFKDRIEINWSDVSDSEEYIVFKSIDNRDQFRAAAVNIKENFYIDENITPNRKYYYKVSAANGDRWSEKSADDLGFAHTGKPVSPEITYVSGNIIGEILVTWESTPQTDFYRILRSDRSNGGFSEITADIPAETGREEYTYTDTAIPERDKSYYYKVISVSLEEGESDPCEPVYGIALQDIPNVPDNINATNGDNAFGNKILVTWDNASLASGYSLYRADREDGDYEKIASGLIPDSTGECFYEDMGIEKDRDYFYKVTALSSGGESEKSYHAIGYADSEKPNQASAPVNIAATNGEFTGITVTWDTVDGVHEYRIYRSSEISGTYTCIGSTGVSETSFTDTDPILTSDLNSFHSFFYYVTAVNGSESRPGVPAQGYAKPLIPETPWDISATLISTDAEITLSFSLCNITSAYHIYRSESINGTYNRIASAPKISDTVTYLENFPAIEVGKTYYYKISSSNVSGESSMTLPAEGSTALRIPGNVQIEGSWYQRKISWDAVPHATHYIVEHKAGSDSWTEHTVTSTEATFSGLKNTRRHYWRVRAVNDNTESGRSEEISSWVI